MALKNIDTQQSINSAYNARANFAPISDAGLAAPHNDLTGICHSGGLAPLYRLTRASSESIKTMSDDDRMIELKSEDVSYPQIVSRFASFDKGASSTLGFGSYYLNGVWILAQKGSADFWTSANGTTWTAKTITAPAGEAASQIYDVIYDGVDYFFLTLGTTLGNLYLQKTNNFTTWGNDYNTGSALSVNFMFYASFGNGYYNILLNNTTVAYVSRYSNDLTTWTDLGSVAIDGKRIQFLNGEHWFFGFNTANLYHSVDGVVWTPETCSIADVQSLTFANGKFIAVGRTGANTDTAYSTTGATADWTSGGTLAIAHDWEGNIVWTGTYYMPFGTDDQTISTTNNQSMYSADGITWTLLALPYTRGWSGAAYNSNTIIVGASGASHLRITLSAGGSRTESIYRAYIGGFKTGEEMLRFGVATSGATSKYQDIKYGATKVYGAHIVGDNVVIDTINADTLLTIAASSTVSAPRARNEFFLRDLSASDNKYIGYNVAGSTYIHIGAVTSAEITEVFTGGYYLSGGAGTSYVLLTNEVISDAFGAVSKKWRTYSMNEATGAVTQITETVGDFYSSNYGGTLYVNGLLVATPAFKSYTISTVGVWTEIFSEAANYSLNGLYSEYNAYKFFSLLGTYSSTSFTSTSVDGVDLLGYFSVIDSFTDGANDFYLRAVFNRATAIRSADSLSFTVNDRYIARSISVSDIDFTYRPHFLKYGDKYYIAFRDTNANIRTISIADIANCPSQFIKVADNVFLINTLDVYNVLDVEAEIIYPSGTDYTGATIRDVLGLTYDERFKIVNDYYESEYNPSETGRPPIASEMIAGYKDQRLIYTSLTRRVYGTTGNVLEDNKFNSIVYLGDHSYVNIDADAKIQNGFIFVTSNVYPSAYTTNNIVGRIMNYDLTAQIGQNFSSADFFFLFGNFYLYDSGTMYLLDVFNGTASEVCKADGLSFLTFSQTEAYFWSYSTNDLYIFNGGRSCEQAAEMHEFFDVDPTQPITGDYLTSDNLIVLQKDDKVALIYDKKISRYDDTGGTAFTRKEGVYYKKLTGKDAGIDSIAKHPLTASFAALSYIWKSAFFKLAGSVSNVAEVQIYIYSATKAAGTLTAYFYAFDEAMTYTTQTVTRVLATGDYDSAGYFCAKFTPNPSDVYGFAIGALVPIDAIIISADVDVKSLRPTTISAGNTMQ